MHEFFVTAYRFVRGQMQNRRHKLFVIKINWRIFRSKFVRGENVRRLHPHAFGEEVNGLLTDERHSANSSCNWDKADMGESCRCRCGHWSMVASRPLWQLRLKRHGRHEDISAWNDIRCGGHRPRYNISCISHVCTS
jgi:hypothetical protein